MKISAADVAVSDALRQISDELSAKLEEIAGQRMHFSLIVFQSEPGSRLNYVSNCQRDYVVGAMQALLQGWRAGMPDVPAHEVN